jgi:hypothetical protein
MRNNKEAAVMAESTVNPDFKTTTARTFFPMVASINRPSVCFCLINRLMGAELGWMMTLTSLLVTELPNPIFNMILFDILDLLFDFFDFPADV